MELLEIENLTFSYGAVKVVDDLTMSVEAGSIHGLIGPNGAGKTTCIDLISGKRRAGTGSIRLRGEEISRRSARRRRHAGMSRSFQKISVFPELTVVDQLELAAHRVSEPDLPAVIDVMELGPVLALRCQEISYGEQRRVDIALALLGNPPLVLLDEPAAGLSSSESIELADHLAQLVSDRGMTVLIVEHDLEVVFRICQTLTVLEQGSAIAQGEPTAIRSDPRVVEAYLGRGHS